MKEKLRLIIEENTNRKGKIFDYSIQFLILLSLVSYSFETLPNNTPQVKSILNFIELFCLVIFSAEYLLRVYVSKNPLRYIFSFYGLIDLIAILPFYLSLTIDLKSLRAFRIFRVFRALKLVRYNKAIKRFRVAATIVKEEIVLFLLSTGILIYFTAAGIYFFENEAQPESFSSIFHSLWWSVVTLTTVGYGDIYPITMGGKAFTFFILIIGVGIVTVPAGLVATALSRARELEEEENRKK